MMNLSSTLKSYRTWLVAGAAAALLAVGGTAAAQGGFGRGFPMMRVFKHLDLTEAQEIRAVKIRRALRDEHKARRKRMQAIMERAKLEVAKANPDPAVLHGAVDEAAKEMTAGMHKAVDQFLELHKTLTPEQREKMVEVMDRVKERRRRHHRRFGGGE